MHGERVEVWRVVGGAHKPRRSGMDSQALASAVSKSDAKGRRRRVAEEGNTVGLNGCSSSGHPLRAPRGMETPDLDRSPVAEGILAGGGAGEFEADHWFSGLLRLGLRPQPRSGEGAPAIAVIHAVLHLP